MYVRYVFIKNLNFEFWIPCTYNAHVLIRVATLKSFERGNAFIFIVNFYYCTRNKLLCVVITHPLHHLQVRKKSSSSCYMIETYNTRHCFPCYWTMDSHILNGILWNFQRILPELQHDRDPVRPHTCIKIRSGGREPRGMSPLL